MKKHDITEEYNPIPAEQERPRFVVLDDDYIAADGRKYSAGVWYFAIKLSKGGKQPTQVERRICSPLHVDAVTFDSEGGNFGRLLRFRDTLGRWRVWAMPMEMLRGDPADLRGVLLSMGVYLDPGYEGRNMLAIYLQHQVPQRKMEAVMQTGWIGGQLKAYVLPDTVIGPQAGQVIFQSESKGKNEYTKCGTLQGWQQGVSALAVGNPMLVLAICAAFAGPLLALVGAEPGGIHFLGVSSTGKTTLLVAGASVWGGDNFRRSWRTTANGVEGAATLFNDCLLALDEISECSPRQVSEVIYMLGNGVGKQRANRAGLARAVQRWRSSVISTGERSIATCMLEAGQPMKAGQAVRMLDIPVQRSYGAWDDLHQHRTGAAFSDALKRASLSNYGTAGRAFLERLTYDTSDLNERLEGIKARLLEGRHCGDDGQPIRAAARLAVLALAGELATDYGITTWPKGEATKAAVVAFEAWLASRGDVRGNAEKHQITQALLNFIDCHGDRRFSNAVGAFDDRQQAMVHERAGWWQFVGDSREYFFTVSGMREALKGFDFDHALMVLRSAGLLDAPATGVASRSKRIHGRCVRVYTVRPDKAIEAEAQA